MNLINRVDLKNLGLDRNKITPKPATKTTIKQESGSKVIYNGDSIKPLHNNHGKISPDYRERKSTELMQSIEKPDYQ